MNQKYMIYGAVVAVIIVIAVVVYMRLPTKIETPVVPAGPAVVIDCNTISVLSLDCARKIFAQEVPTCSAFAINQTFVDEFVKFNNDILAVPPIASPVSMEEKKVSYFHKLSLAERLVLYIVITWSTLSKKCGTVPPKEKLGARMVKIADEFYAIV